MGEYLFNCSNTMRKHHQHIPSCRHNYLQDFRQHHRFSVDVNVKRILSKEPLRAKKTLSKQAAKVEQCAMSVHAFAMYARASKARTSKGTPQSNLLRYCLQFHKEWCKISTRFDAITDIQHGIGAHIIQRHKFTLIAHSLTDKQVRC
jgi:hypothetical protein